MKKTNSDANYSLKAFLNERLMSLPNKPSGILSNDRLDNSTLEDVIIEPLPLNFKQIQEGVLNVNIFVENLNFELGEGVDKRNDTSQRNSGRIAEIERMLVDIFDADDVFQFDYNFSLQQTAVYPDGETAHYINARIEYTALSM